MNNYLEELAEAIRSECGGGPIELYRFYALLARAKAPDVTNEDVHDAWVAWCLGVQPHHRSIGPYALLAPEVQDLDAPYRDEINRWGKRAREVADAPR